MTTLYGISNCDTIKKARKWLQDNGIDYTFHDYKKQGIDRDSLQKWCQEFGYEALVNKRGTTWRKLDDNVKADLDESKAIDIMSTHHSVIKRPILVSDGKNILGFDEDKYKSLL